MGYSRDSFDVNSANIKPESYGTLKEMANVLKEYSDLKVKIVGHTDADGNDASNLDLSKKEQPLLKQPWLKNLESMKPGWKRMVKAKANLLIKTIILLVKQIIAE
ncbi:MAG: OmpA family protein [Bacteroidia bacterium]|nr:OmpA family protein [Bacteroidia bacterium]